MADITWSDVTNHVASLSTLDSNAQTDILAFVNAQVNYGRLDDEAGPLTKLARVYLAAHFGTVLAGATGGSSGPVMEEKAGELSRKYSDLSNLMGSGLGETSYGRAFQTLVKGAAGVRVPFVA